MHEEFVNKVIEGLQNIYKKAKYSIYDEGHIAFLIRNEIWNNYGDKEYYYIFNEFPIKLKYPRFFTPNVYENIINSDEFKNINIQNIFRPPVAGYAELNEDVSLENRDKLVKYFENKEPNSTDVGIVNVDFSIIKTNDYSSSGVGDKYISNHECVLQIKFERGRENRTLSKSSVNNGSYIRNDINKNNTTNDRRSILRDVKNVCHIVEDKISKSGYFMFICEGNKSISKYFRACEDNELTGRFWDEKKNIELLFNAQNKHDFKEYCDNGFIYIYEKKKDNCKAWTVPLRPQN